MGKVAGRARRHFRIRKHLAGTGNCPRISVFRSGKHIYVQIIDDSQGKTLLSESDLKITKKVTKASSAFEVGKTLAARALKKGIKVAVFDRGGFLYHGRVEQVAAGLREGGLKF